MDKTEIILGILASIAMGLVVAMVGAITSMSEGQPVAGFESEIINSNK